MNDAKNKPWELVGTLVTPMRIVLGWAFFSAFWRRAVLMTAKLDPNAPGYVGTKFDNFLPGALWIKPMIEYLLLNREALYVFLLVFSVIEALVGLALLSGLGTRLAALGAALLSWGILLGAGWIGTTCLDEWQIGTAGIAAGLTIFLTGAGRWSLDQWWRQRWPSLANHPLLPWFSSGPLFARVDSQKVARLAGVLVVLSIGIDLYTNQAFFGGVWGTLHNPSKQPHITITDPSLTQTGVLQMTLFRDGGPDTYGAFVVNVMVKDSADKVVERFDFKQLAALPAADIANHYPLKVHPGPYSLVLPLGSQAKITLQPAKPAAISRGMYKLEVTDVSGLHWSRMLNIP